MKKNPLSFLIRFAVLPILLFSQTVYSQTSPTAQTLPYSQNFGTTTFTSAPAGVAVWNGLSGNSITNQVTAEASAPTGNATLSTATAATSTGGAFGYASGGNAQLYIQTSSNASNGANQPAIAINTSGLQDIVLSYAIDVISAQPKTIGVVAQYRVGTTGSWTTLTPSSGSNPFSQAGGTTGLKTTVTATLPSAANNQPVVQIRWAVWRGTEAGNSSGFGLDNISVTGSGGTAPPAPVVSFATAVTTSGFTANWQAATGATTYFLDVATDSGFTSLVAGFSNLNVGGATSAAVTGLSPSTTYYYRVRASNSAGTSANSQTQVALTASLNAPSIAVSPSTITNFFYNGVGPSEAQAVSVTASNLTGFPGALSVSGSTSFEVSTTSSNSGFGSSALVSFSTNTLAATDLWIRLKAGLAAGTYTNETVTVSGGGAATPGTVTVSGSVLIPSISVTTTNLGTFTATNGIGSASKTLTVSGSSLSAPVSVVAPTNFEVGLATNSYSTSLSLTNNGTLSNTPVLVRISPSASLGVIATNSIVVSSLGASNRLVQVAGSVVNGSIGMSINDTNSVVVNEGAAPLTLNVALSTPAPAGGTTVALTTTDNDNSEIILSPTTLVFTEGQTNQTATVTPLSDSVFDVDQTVVISAAATNWLSSGTVSVRVVNTDPAPPAFISLLNTNTNSYTQNFNSLGTVTISNAFSATAGVQTSLGGAVSTNLDGWYGAKTAGSGTSSLPLSADSGTGSSGTIYNYGSTNTNAGANLDRSLGSLATSTTIPAIGALIKNDTGTNINSVKVSMTAELWRSSTVTNTLTCSYGKVDGSTVTVSNFLTTASSTTLPSLSVTMPASAGNSAVDGNAATNQVGFTNVLVPVALAPGEVAFIKWEDADEANSDAGISLDNLSLTASLDLPPADGTGSATILNGDGNSDFYNQNIFGRSLTDQTVFISFVPQYTQAPVTALSISVPTEMGAPIAGNVSVGGNGAGSAAVSVTGQVITITGLTALNPDPVEVTISGLSTPNTAASVTNSGRYTFAMQSQGDGGSLSPLGTSPTAVVIIPIANARNFDPTTFVPTLLNQTVAVEGVANVGKLGTGQISSALQDSTHGIGTYSTNVANLPIRGNRYVISGAVQQSSGYVRINITNASAVYDFGPVSDPAPLTVTVPEFNASTGATNGITLQSRVVRLENLFYVSGTWATTNNVVLRDAASNNITVRIQANSTAVSPPSYPVTLTGIAGQFDAASPFNTGFQIQPRDQADAPVLAPVITSALTATATNNQPFSYQITTDNNPPATSFGASPLPTGLNFNSTTGLISGTPTVPGSYNVTISASNAGGTDIETLVVNVVQSGSTFTSWAQGAPLNSTNLLLYSIGGATSPTATNGIAMSNAVTSSNLSITAIVRTNDPNLSVFGQSIVNLGAGTWTNNDVSRITNGVDQAGVPSGNQRQIFSTPLGTDGKKFLRLQTTLSNQ